MTFRTFLAGLLLSALTLDVAAVDPEPRPAAQDKPAGGGKGKARGQAERTCALTITWWEDPVLPEGETLELGVQGDREVTPIHPSAMNPGGTFLYEGPAKVTVVRKTLVPNPNGKPDAKPVDGWLPYAQFTLGDGDQETLAIMFAAEGAQKAMVRSFNIDAASFPFGGFDVLNFSKSRLLCSMGGKVFFAEPGKRVRSPLVIAKREVVNFFMGVTDADGVQKLIYRAPLILSEKNRRLYFVLDNPDPAAPNRFIAHTMIQHVAGHRTIETLRGQGGAPRREETAPVPSPEAAPEAPKKGAPKAKAA
ncbi:MAG: hypothetical protein FJ384_05630 [Verrucomicrobia bacterium]|nr:hypothetical protein [Verrucomicrobiota bacterium]